jgi:hypothetical protein
MDNIEDQTDRTALMIAAATGASYAEALGFLVTSLVKLDA